MAAASQEKQTQSKPILKQMNVSFCATGYYESNSKFAANYPNVEITTANVEVPNLVAIAVDTCPIIWRHSCNTIYAI